METSLRARVRAGDPDAFRQLFDEYASVVYRHAVRLTGDWAMADDIVSLTFLEAWRLRERLFPGDDSPRPWLLGIATNVTRNTARAARRHQAALARLPPPGPVPDFADEVAQRLADTEELTAAQRALRTMRRGEREVFTLCVWEGLDAATAAEALGVAVGTVRARLSRARKRLRKLTELELIGGPDGNGGTSGTGGNRGMGGNQGAGHGTGHDTVQRATTAGQIPGSRHQAARSTQEKKP
ncbi:sigma-70 family RNA polymerase sigma factor [Streptomyces sp. SID8361]|uniref:RNA polymerase sigma factor n=1 Tax=Streptomyces sp. MnatMP-M27 TaxID=1839768 RepID=UPI00081F1362|nr:RNA polymerase sigma factor [Streptomyces sp. MnatMP-M27]MYU13044.1 sigma-70 family RNA polymerase sigma factor [Streptomyces sp. SID8361]SCF97407.1 RNA polymerase sigma-70 factor, ECF subfamily [Streptomyces sp. MnatMP-M27]